MTSIIKKLKDIVTQTIALDKAMTSLQMVTQYTDAQMQDLKQTYIDLAQEMGVAVSTVTNGADEFLRAGLSAAETNDALRASLILSSVANMDSATSTKYLIAAMNAYGLKAEELVSVVDKLSAVDIVAATSSEELGEALSLSASSAQLAGIELDKFLGMIATVSETTRQSASSIGNSFKTIFARMQQVKIGSLVDEDGENISNVSRVLSQYGINLMEVTDQMTDMGALFDLLGDKWNEYSTATRSELATTIAGVRQRDKFLVLMNNYNRALELSTVSTESAGSAQEKYNIYLESTEAKINQMESAWTELTQATLSSGVVEFFIEFATWITKVQTAVGGLIPLITGALSLILLIKGQKIAKGIISAVEGIKTMAIALKTATLSATGLTAALSASFAILTVGIMLYNGIKNAISSARKEQEAYRAETVAAAKTQIDTISELRSEYQKLWDLENKTSEQHSRMAEILNTLRNSFGGATDAAKEYKDGLAEVNDLTKEGLMLDYQKIIEANKKSYNKAQEELSEQGTTFSEKKKFGKYRTGAVAAENYRIEAEKLGLNADMFEAGLLTQSSGKIHISGTYEEQKAQLEEAVSYYEDLMVQNSKVGKNLTDTENKVYTSVVKMLSDLTSDYSKYVEVVDEVTKAEEALQHLRAGDYLEWINSKTEDATESLDVYNGQLSKLNDNLTAVASKINDAVNGLKDETKVLKEQKELQDELLSVEEARANLAKAKRKTVGVYRADLGKIVYHEDTSEVQSAQKNLTKALDDLGDYKYELALENANLFVEELNEIINKGTIVDEWETLFDKYGDLLGEEFSIYLKMAQDYVDSFNKITGGASGIITTNTGLSNTNMSGVNSFSGLLKNSISSVKDQFSNIFGKIQANNSSSSTSQVFNIGKVIMEDVSDSFGFIKSLTNFSVKV